MSYEEIIQALGTAGEVVALVLATAFIVRVLSSTAVSIVTIWREAARDRNQIDSKRNEIDETFATTLKAAAMTLERLQNNNMQMVTAVQALTHEGNTGRADLARSFETKAAMMKDVVQRRDGEQKNLQSQYEKIIQRLDEHQTQLDTIAQQVTAETDENTLRGQMAKMLLLTKEIGIDIKRLIETRRDTDTEKTAPPENETKQEATNDGTQ